ncbi:Thiamine-monophosphate kinase [Rhodovastum atsumiense]|uniref:Thiamine-monophosphate kinase n=1 Tax=Rhodovastum atsumiense TaxID=504468 RepID=A0A5M6IJX1_9PROT|nr:thiamine-phosphate kinase [Rhodovastum atsumiense]KAA5608482.1 thiamine-phosphate kinase [Rhodovastum atsumiense]CAH2599306.1 Thiamine-monophosphate kinase [Rhodovastum atsumiense]
MSDLPAEFALIARHFRPLAGPGALDLGDDAAVVAPPPGRELVIAADAMVAGVHFLPDDPPDLIGRKLLRTNLSDLAAMGAEPFGYLMTVSVPRGTPDGWFAGFAAGLDADQREFGIALLGGDTTSTPGPVSLSLTVLGHVAPGAALRRVGAQPGHALYVSGTIGDAALGLLALRGEVADADGVLADRYRLPRPRLALGRRLHGIAAACMDVSDGLVQDAGHLCRAGGLGCTILAAELPLSAAARRVGRLETCLTGGDDYELLFAVPPEREAALADAPVTRIGHFHAGPARVAVLGPDGAPMPLAGGGWSHFG